MKDVIDLFNARMDRLEKKIDRLVSLEYKLIGAFSLIVFGLTVFKIFK